MTVFAGALRINELMEGFVSKVHTYANVPI